MPESVVGVSGERDAIEYLARLLSSLSVFCPAVTQFDFKLTFL